MTEIMVAIGDSIEEEQSLITVEGDKASMEVFQRPFAGVLKELKVNLWRYSIYRFFNYGI